MYKHPAFVRQWVVLLHVAVPFWFVAGLLGRNVTMAKARPATDIRRAAIRQQGVG
jgi:hypothetical protein